MTRWTKRVDGSLRADVRPIHHVTAHDMAYALALHHEMKQDPHDPEWVAKACAGIAQANKDGARTAMCDLLHDNGYNGENWPELWGSDGDAAVLMGAAKRRLEALWPEVAPC